MTRMPQNLKPMMNTSSWMDSEKQGVYAEIKLGVYAEIKKYP